MIKNYAIAISVLVGLFTLVGFIAGGYTFLDQRYALADEHRILEVRVTIHELNHVYRRALEDLFFYRAQVRAHPDDQKIKFKLEEAESTSEKLKGQISQMEIQREKLKNER